MVGLFVPTMLTILLTLPSSQNLLPIHTDFLRFFPGTSLSEDGEVLWSKYRDTPKYVRFLCPRAVSLAVSYWESRV